MTATRIPQSPTPSIPPTPNWLAARIALGVAVVVGAVGLGYIGNSLSAVIAIAVLAGVVVGIGLIINRPEYLMPAALLAIWFESVGFGPINAGRVIAGLVPLVILFRAMTTGWRPPALQARAWVPLLIFVIWVWCGAFFAQSVLRGWMYDSVVFFIGPAYWLVFVMFTESPKQLTAVLKIWVWTGSVIALLSDFAFFGLGYRGYGFTGGANSYGAILVAGLPLIVVLARQETGQARFWMWVNLPIFLSAIAASGSRMALIMTGFMGAYIFVTLPGLDRRRRALSIVGGGFAMAFGFFIFILLNPDRFTVAALFSDRGAGRLDIWPAAFEMISDHPIQGRGLGGFRVDSYEVTQRTTGAGLDILREDIDLGYIETHNLYLYLMTDSGLIGLTLYFGLIAATFKNLFDLRRTQWASYAWAFAGIVIALLIGQFFYTALNQKVMWLVLGITSSCYTKKRVERRVVTVAAG